MPLTKAPPSPSVTRSGQVAEFTYIHHSPGQLRQPLVPVVFCSIQVPRQSPRPRPRHPSSDTQSPLSHPHPPPQKITTKTRALSLATTKQNKTKHTTNLVYASRCARQPERFNCFALPSTNCHSIKHAGMLFACLLDAAVFHPLPGKINFPRNGASPAPS